MTLLDANALISLLRDQPAAAEVSALLRRGNCATPASCLSEVVDRLIRKHRADADAVSKSLGPLIEEAILLLPVNQHIAWRAGEIRSAHYDRNTRALSLADCILLATAEADDEIATSDGVVALTAGELGIGVIPLPDSNGNRPAA